MAPPFIRCKDRKADKFGSIFIEQNKGFVILAPAKTLKKLSPPNILKMNARFNMMLAASLFLLWRLKVEIKRVYEIADHAFALSPIF